MAYGDKVRGQGGSSTVALRSLVPVVLVKVWLQLGETLTEVANFQCLACKRQAENAACHHNLNPSALPQYDYGQENFLKPDWWSRRG